MRFVHLLRGVCQRHHPILHPVEDGRFPVGQDAHSGCGQRREDAYGVESGPEDAREIRGGWILCCLGLEPLGYLVHRRMQPIGL
jgi:hypothetical protein